MMIMSLKWSEVKWSEVSQSCLTLCDPVDCSPPGSSNHGFLQARILEWVAISFSRGSSRPRDQTRVSHIGGRCFNLWATREDQRSCLWTMSQSIEGQVSYLFFFRIDLDVHRHLFFYIHFRVSFCKFPKVSCWYFDASRIWRWIDRFRENWHLYNDKSSICQHGTYHHLFRSLCLIMELKKFIWKCSVYFH